MKGHILPTNKNIIQVSSFSFLSILSLSYLPFLSIQFPSHPFLHTNSFSFLIFFGAYSHIHLLYLRNSVFTSYIYRGYFSVLFFSQELHNLSPSRIVPNQVWILCVTIEKFQELAIKST